ncbi:MAG: DUF5615 family PIN-like protein [Chitinophagales bacterium]|nr:DUF5615 family PIN-like protein [Chitinophagales bacterium]
MKLLANENIPISTVHKLIELGYDIQSIGLHFSGISDEDVMRIAIEQERTIITFDKDYGELIYKKGYKPKAGVVYLRILNYTPQSPAHLLHEIFQKPEIHFENNFTVVSKNKIRQRKY